MQHDFRVAARLKDGATPHEVVAQLARVDEIAVVANRDLPVRTIDEDRLGIGKLALARRRVANVADRRRSGQLCECFAVEGIGDIAHRARHAHVLTVGRCNSRAFLPAVLQRVQSEIRHVGRLGMSEDAEDAALVLEFIEHGVQATR